MQGLWIRVAANMGARKVTARLSAVLRAEDMGGMSRGLSRAAAVGHLVMLWGNVAENTTGGYIADVPDDLLEDWAGWDGAPGVFARWLREQHVTDGRINDWDEYAGALEDRREKDRVRKQRQREREKDSEGRPRDVRVTSGRTNGTGRNENDELHTAPNGAVVGAGAPEARRAPAGGLRLEPPPPTAGSDAPSLEPAALNGSHPNGVSSPGTSLVVAAPRHVTVSTATKGEAKTLAVVESRLAEIQQAVAAQRDRALHEQQLMRYKIGVAFAYWAKITGHVRTALDAAAEALIRQHLKLAKADTVGDLGFLLYAVDGYQKSDWHMRRGPRGGDKHDWLKDILRDRQSAQELAEKCRGYREGQPHATAMQYLAALTAPKDGDDARSN